MTSEETIQNSYSHLNLDMNHTNSAQSNRTRHSAPAPPVENPNLLHTPTPPSSPNETSPLLPEAAIQINFSTVVNSQITDFKMQEEDSSENNPETPPSPKRKESGSQSNEERPSKEKEEEREKTGESMTTYDLI